MGKTGLEGYFLGVDVGTQGTKTILCDAGNGNVIASARDDYPLIEKADGTREQDPGLWVRAVVNTIRAVLKSSDLQKSSIKGIGISGQQHGFVPLDEGGGFSRCDNSVNGCGGFCEFQNKLFRSHHGGN
jgi:Sugar (pentulose and hexulose) kinases